ncbi:hypothetical protein DAMA08_014580 [Martiniozyma asiatica (nom. inval.)]|nr:hypothetical protein DAMA08_014580 [Martiniozyma asiatica]
MVLVVHLGAGESPFDARSFTEKLALRKKYRRLVRNVYRIGSAGQTPESIFQEVSELIELDPLTNSGHNGNLNIEGQLRCDASVVKWADGEIDCFSMGDIPSLTPMKVVLAQLNAVSKGNVLKPVTLVANNEGKCNCNDKDANKDKNVSAGGCTEHYSNDTIGVILHTTEECLCGSSSAGNMNKPIGRLGSAAVIGAGCWTAVDKAKGLICSVCTSGSGEDIIISQLARSVSQRLLERFDMNAESTMVSHLLDSIILETFQFLNLRYGKIYVGIVGVISMDKGSIVFVYHTTPIFIFGIEGECYFSDNPHCGQEWWLPAP